MALGTPKHEKVTLQNGLSGMKWHMKLTPKIKSWPGPIFRIFRKHSHGCQMQVAAMCLARRGWGRSRRPEGRWEPPGQGWSWKCLWWWKQTWEEIREERLSLLLPLPWEMMRQITSVFSIASIFQSLIWTKVLPTLSPAWFDNFTIIPGN